ncbi:MAG: hypothetical protein ACTHMS_07675 [Jatrophihabitans sp.]|uniref:hypothetical protein n=1 Tax=Jatrophihabitans sp. TaxID=1932789 RepID=UPI003F8193B6
MAFDTLPGFLIPPLSWIGVHWPDVDEFQLLEIANNWSGMSGDALSIAQKAEQTAKMVAGMDSQDVSDSDIAAFTDWFYGDDGPLKRLSDDSVGSDLIRLSCYVMAGVVIALKIYCVIQLVQLLIEVLSALAAAWATFGASTASIPGFILFVRGLVEAAIEAAVEAIKTEIKDILDNALQMLVKVAVRQAAAALGHLAGGGNLGDSLAGSLTGGLKEIGSDFLSGHGSGVTPPSTS